MGRPERKRLPATRQSVTHKFTITSEKGPVSFYLIVGLYDNGNPGEIFIKEDVTEEPFADQWARAASLLLQVGFTTADLVHWFGYSRFEPSGYTDNADIRQAMSVADYVVRYLNLNHETRDV